MGPTSTRIERLLALAAVHSDLLLIEACAGSGKKELMRPLAQSSGAMDSTLEADMDNMPADLPTMLVEGEAIATHPKIDAALARLLPRTRSTPLIVITRRFGPQTRSVIEQHRLRVLGPGDLWFTAEEIRDALQAVGGEGDHADALHELTDGWPALVWDVLDELSGEPTDGSRLRRAATRSLANRLESSVAALSSNQVDALRVAVFLPHVDTETATLLGEPDLVSALVEAGFPVLDRSGARAGLSTQSRSWLQQNLGGSSTEVSRKIFDHLAQTGFPLEAAEAAHALGLSDLAARLLSGLSGDTVVSSDPELLATLFIRLGSSTDTYPRCALVHARSMLSQGRVVEAEQILQSGVALTKGMSSDSPLEELQSELGMTWYLMGRVDEAETLLRPSSFTDQLAEARRLEVLAGIGALAMTEQSLADAITGYEQASRIWRANGQVESAAATDTRLAMEAISRLGRLPEAIRLLERAEQTLMAHPMRALGIRIFRARLLAFLGSADAIEVVDECASMAAVVELPWLHGYAENVRCLIASQAGDADAVRQAETRAREAFAELMQVGAGAIFLADLVHAYINCGAIDDARRCLTELEAHPAGESCDVQFAGVALHCHAGDPTEAERRLVAFEDAGLVTPMGNWRLHLARAARFTRCSQHSAGEAALVIAQTAAGKVGTPNIIDRTCPGLVRREATNEAESTPNAASSQGPEEQPVDIQLFNTFLVTRGSTDLSVPRGRPSTLIKVLVLDGGQLTIDAAIDALWPAGDPATGRKRLRNILSRVKAACGTIILRDGELLRLATEAVDADYTAWMESAQAALRTSGTGASSTEEVGRLLAIAPNELLPADRYEEWLQPRQDRYQTMLIRLLDLTISRAVAQDQLDAAVSSYHRVLDLAPHDEERLSAAIALMRSAGHADAAQTLERRRPQS